MPIIFCPEPTLVNMGRGKVYSPIGDNKSELHHLDIQQHNGLNNGYVHFPSTSLRVLPPNSTTFRPLHRVDNFLKTSGDNMCSLKY
tara:strand:- start:218 stop:475 length:258 start_codon:yes stop_codon:yes gene_type:complete